MDALVWGLTELMVKKKGEGFVLIRGNYLGKICTFTNKIEIDESSQGI